ncbi:hypothetical protein GQ457_10G016320 [Hibiscus cannabinus]
MLVKAGSSGEQYGLCRAHCELLGDLSASEKKNKVSNGGEITGDSWFEEPSPPMITFTAKKDPRHIHPLSLTCGQTSVDEDRMSPLGIKCGEASRVNRVQKDTKIFNTSVGVSTDPYLFTDAGLSGGALSLSGSTPEAVSSVKVGEHKVRTFVVVQENPATWENGWTPYKLVG